MNSMARLSAMPNPVPSSAIHRYTRPTGATSSPTRALAAQPVATATRARAETPRPARVGPSSAPAMLIRLDSDSISPAPARLIPASASSVGSQDEAV
jgi:hypothetical protein